jgi:pimeloyl-ACP methyl ester carboxylesterase
MTATMVVRTFLCLWLMSSLSWAESIEEVPVTFQVWNTNTSLVPCASDGLPYEVKGHLVAPQSVLAASARAVTLYLHGAEAGEWMWRFKAVPGYDYALEMAKLGHASVAIDRLGVKTSGHPAGFMMCIGSEADVYHQILGQLRSGDYDAGGAPGPRFDKVALAGLSAGAYLTEVTTYSYPGAADAIVIMGWVDPIPTSPRFTLDHGPEVASYALPRCLMGGEPAEDGDPRSPSGYSYALDADRLAENVFYNVDPEAAAAFRTLVNRDACGHFFSIPTMVLVNTLLVGTVSTPVLIVAGDHDLVSEQDVHRHALSFVSSRDVSVKVIEDTGHVGVLERTAPVMRARISSWLAVHGF